MPPLVPMYSDVELGWSLLSWEGEAQWMAKKQDWTGGGRLTSIDQLRGAIKNADAFGWHFYLNLNPVVRGIKYASRPHVTHWRYAMLDLDPLDPGAPPPIVAPPWTMAAAIFTGRGYQYWLPIEGCPLPPEWAEESMRALHRSTDVVGWRLDPTCSDLPRRVRCPGSINPRTGERARVLTPPAGTWAPQPTAAPIHIPPPKISSGNVNLGGVLAHLRLYNVAAAIFLQEGQEHPGRHTACFTLIKSLQEAGIPPEDALPLATIGARKCRPVLTDKEVLKIIRQVYR